MQEHNTEPFFDRLITGDESINNPYIIIHSTKGNSSHWSNRHKVPVNTDLHTKEALLCICGIIHFEVLKPSMNWSIYYGQLDPVNEFIIDKS